MGAVRSESKTEKGGKTGLLTPPLVNGYFIKGGTAEKRAKKPNLISKLCTWCKGTCCWEERRNDFKQATVKIRFFWEERGLSPKIYLKGGK